MGMRLRRHDLFLLLALTASSAAAEPVVETVSGIAGHNQVLTVQGRGFGARGDFHPNPDKMIRMFDDFNDGELRGNPYGLWTIFNESARPAEFLAGEGRSGLSDDGIYRRKRVDLGSLYIQAGDRPAYYSSFYMRLSPQFDIASSNAGTHQFKIVRIFSVNEKFNVYPSFGANDGFHMSAEFAEPPVLRHQLQVDGIPDRPQGWNKLAIYYKKSSARNANDGRMILWWNNRQVFNWRSHFAGGANAAVQGDFDSDGADLAGDWSVGHYFSSASGGTYADFDDVYLDHSIARVELGNAPDIDACSVLEIQPPRTWSDRRLQVTVNAGAFKPGAKVYLYVTDEDGRVNLQGFPVTVGAAAARAAAGPVVEIVTPTPSSETDHIRVDARVSTLELRGTASGPDAVARVAWSADNGRRGEAVGTNAWRAAGIPLAQGANVITVTATDAQGREGATEIRVLRGGVATAADALRPPKKFLSPGKPGETGRLVFGKDAVAVLIHDYRGDTVFDDRKTGNEPLVWTGQDSRGNALPSGVYICKITGASGHTVYHSVAVVK